MRLVNTRIVASAVLSLALLILPAAASAQLDYSRYVSVGDSLTAGFISGSLIESAQDTSYPAQIIGQATGGAGFEQPLVSAPGIPAVLQLQSLSPLVIAPLPGLGQPLNLTLPRPYNNIAVPGADADDVLNTITDNGGLHDLILRGLGTQVQQAAVFQPSLLTLWVGNNDVLAAATSGVVIEDVTLTSLASFEASYRAITGALLTGPALTGAALANIPGVTSIPFVTTLSPVLEGPGGIQIPVLGPDGPLSPDDFVLLSASPLLAQGIGIPAAAGGTGQPLPDTAVLSADEAATIETRVGEFNALIASIASEFGVALVDANGIFADIAANGLHVGGIDYSTEFLLGGIFSYDGVHPTQFGYALTAQAFIDALNERYGANIPTINFSPFVFGPEGTAPGAAALPSAAGELIFSRKAYKNLRFALDIPRPKKLMRLKRKAERMEKASARASRRDRGDEAVGKTPERGRERPAKARRQDRDTSTRRVRIHR
jgi:lysophospholipase L1-like esterase